MLQIPRQTLQDHLKFDQLKKPGRPPAMRNGDEESLTQFTIHMSKMGHGLSLGMITAYAAAILEKSAPNSSEVSYEWARRFVKRNGLSTRYDSLD